VRRQFDRAQADRVAVVEPVVHARSGVLHDRKVGEERRGPKSHRATSPSSFTCRNMRAATFSRGRTEVLRES
jgi:hypothetical protein